MKSVAGAQKALVLDFGGVISRTLFETHDLTERALGLRPGSLTWRGPFDPTGDALWAQMQANHISERDYWLQRSQEVGAMLGESWSDMQTLVRRARGAEPGRIVRPETLALIEAAKAAGCRLAILSNELDLFYGAELRQRLECLRHFDVIVDATYTQCLKPDPQAYAECLRQLQLPAAQCLLVDDQQRNVDGALRCGMPALWFDVQAPALACAQAAEWLRFSKPA